MSEEEFKSKLRWRFVWAKKVEIFEVNVCESLRGSTVLHYSIPLSITTYQHFPTDNPSPSSSFCFQFFFLHSYLKASSLQESMSMQRSDGSRFCWTDNLPLSFTFLLHTICYFLFRPPSHYYLTPKYSYNIFLNSYNANNKNKMKFNLNWVCTLVCLLLTPIYVVCNESEVNDQTQSFIVPPTTVKSIDLNAYLGRWYQMYASMNPNQTYERNGVCITGDYFGFLISQSRLDLLILKGKPHSITVIVC